MANDTLAFDPQAEGWTTRFSYLPDKILSLNNKLYTMENGRLWQHAHENADINTFYGIHDNSVLTFVVNMEPSTVKSFKALSIEGTGDWTVAMKTNLEEGVIEASYFVDKEGKKFAWIRGDGNTLIDVDFEANSVVGIGAIHNIHSFRVTENNQMVNLTAFEFTHPIPSSISDGDVLYIVENTDQTNTPKPAAVRIKSIGGYDNLVNADNYIVIYNADTGIIGYKVDGTDEEVDIQLPVTGDFMFAVKNNTVETSGIIGFYNEITMTNSDAELVELFAVNTEVTQSS